MSSQEGSRRQLAREESIRASSNCPGCGQRLDRAMRRCPRCRLWLLPLPAPSKPWNRVVIIGGLVALAVGSFLAGMVLQAFFSTVPADVVVSEDAAPPGLESR